MAASAMTPKLLDRISNEKYQDKDKWKIDDFALGPENELLISGHNLQIPDTFISMYKEDSGKYGNRPEFNKNFKQTRPSEQMVLFLEGNSIIGLKVDRAMRLVTIEDMSVLEVVKWKQSPTCVCFYRGKMYTASNSSTIVSVCNLDLEHENNICLSDIEGDCVLEIVVMMEKICVCTKDAGRALVFSMTGSKEMEFKNSVQTDAKATSICIHERTELVFVLWNNIQIQLYSQNTSQCLCAMDMNEQLHKIRVTTKNILVTSSASKCTVTVYDVGEAIKFGEFQNSILSSVKKKHWKKLISHDVENLESHPAEFETFSFPRKSASKQSKVEKLRDRKELDMKQLEENENLRRQYDREVQKVDERVRTIEEAAYSNENVQETIHEGVAPAVSEVISQTKGVTNLKKGKASKTTLEDEVTQLKKRLLVEEKTTKEAQSYSLILNDRIKALEDMRTELQSQQKKLKDTLDQEKDKVTRAEGSRSQVVTNLKKVEERNTKLEDEVTQLKERLLVEEKTTKEVQTSSLILNERIKDLEDMRTELVSHQKKLKDTLDQEKDKVTRAEASRVQLNERIKDLEDMRTELVSQQKKLKDILDEERDKVTRAEASRVQAMTTCEKLQKAYEILQKEKEDLSEQLSTEKSNTEIQIASFSKMTSHALSGSEKMAQRKDEDSYLCDETQSVITESTDSGRGSMHSGLEYHDPFTLNGRQLKTELKVAVTVTYRGANMHIPDTGVALDIPAGAVGGKVLIEMIILPFDKLDAPVSTFSCNSSVAVELLPNKMEFHKPVRLILPHCLKLTKNYKKTKNQVQVYVSHHETGPPIWEEVSHAEYVLNETNCVIFVKSFCWVKYEVNNKIVEAKRIRAYTAGKRLKYTEDSLAEIEVGYHWDLPNARENLSMSDNMFVYQSKPFIYVKDGNLPLEIFLTKSVPKQWKYITPEDNPKVISFKCVADSTEKSCPFVIEKSEPTDRMPFCMFKVQQGNEDLELYIRFDD